MYGEAQGDLENWASSKRWERERQGPWCLTPSVP